MTIQTINIGVEGNDGTGDSIRGAFTKVNENFDYVAKATGIEGGLRLKNLSDVTLVDGEAYGPDQIIMGNSGAGDKLIARNIVGGRNVTVTINEQGQLEVAAPSISLFEDNTPRLKVALNANGKVIGNLPYPDTAALALYNSQWGPISGALSNTDTLAVTVKYATEKFLSIYNGAIGYKDSSGNVIQPSLASEPAQVDITSEFYDPTLTGNYLSTSIVPRKDLVYRGGDTMSGPLYLSNHPSPLAGVITDDPIDLQAATKYYVDTKTFSSNVNLYVSTSSGDDLQSSTPTGKEGRYWNYAFKTIKSALVHAQSLIDLASQEPGPYKQRISYTKNSSDLFFSTIQKVSLTEGKTTDADYIAAYDLLQLNRAFIQTETIAYINKKYVNTYSYNESILRTKITNLITAVADDLMLGGFLSTQLNYNSTQYAIEYIKTHSTSDELIQWNSIINFVKNQYLDFSYDKAKLQAYTSNVVYALCYDALFESNYQSVQQGISFSNLNTGITTDQLSSVLSINPITINSAKYESGNLTLYFDTQATNVFPTGSQIIVNATFTQLTSVKSLSNFKAIVLAPADITTVTSQIKFAVGTFTDPGAYVVTKNANTTKPYFDRCNLINQILTIPEVHNTPSLVDSFIKNAALIASIAAGDRLPTILMPSLINTPENYGTVSYNNAKELLLVNISFIQSEVLSYLSAEFPSATYDSEDCIRDVKYIVWSIAYDLTYGGNSQSVHSAIQIRSFITNNLNVSLFAYVSAMEYINTLAQAVIQNESVATIYQQSVKQYRNTSLSGGVIASSSISNNITAIVNIVNGGSLPTIGNLLVSYADASTKSITDKVITYIPEYTTATDSNGDAITTTPWFINHFYPVISDHLTQITDLFTYISTTITKGSYPSVAPIYPTYETNVASAYGSTTTFETLATARSNIETNLTTEVDAIYTSRLGLNKIVSGVSATVYKQYVKDVYRAVAYDITYGGGSATLAAKSFLNNIDITTSEVINLIKTSIKKITDVRLKIAVTTSGTEFTVNVAHQSSGIVNFSITKVSTGVTYTGFTATLIQGNTTVVLSVGNLNTYSLGANDLIIQTSTYNQTTPGRFGIKPINTYIDIAFTATSTSNNTELLTTLQDIEPFKTANILRSVIVDNIPTILNDTIQYVNNTFAGGFNYNETLCYRDLGSIINAMSIDLITGGTWQSINAGKSFYKNASGILVASGAQRVQSLDGIDFARDLALQVLNKEYNTRYQNLILQVSTNSNSSILPSTAINVTLDNRMLLAVSVDARAKFVNNFKIMRDIVNDGIGVAPTITIDTFGTGLWHIAISNGSNGYVDQGKPNNIDLFPAKIIYGAGKQSNNVTASTATASIVKYVAGTDTAVISGGLANVDSIQVRLIRPDFFTLNEEVEFGETVPDLQITMFVESGIYYEDYPLRLPANVSLKGDEFRRTIIRPIDRVSQSPWRKLFFYRDAIIDALEIGVVDYNGINNAPAGVSATVSGTTSKITVTLTNLDTAGNTVGYQALLSWVGNVFTDLEVDRDRVFASATAVSVTIATVSGTTTGTVVSTNLTGTINIGDYVGDAVADTNNYIPSGSVVTSVSSSTAGQVTTITFGIKFPSTIDAVLSSTTVALKFVKSDEGNKKRGKAVVDSVSGNIMNCTVIYPFDFSKTLVASKWKLLNTKNYGHHYLTDPSDPTSIAKNNKDIDVLLCNEGNRVVGVTFQGHGGFAMVLDPTGNIKTKSPYIQECSSFTQSNNYKRFAGGQYIDGFAGRVYGTITGVADNGITVTVQGTVRTTGTFVSWTANTKTLVVDNVDKTITKDSIVSGTGFTANQYVVSALFANSQWTVVLNAAADTNVTPAGTFIFGPSSGLDIRPPQAPCAFYVRGKRYQIDDVIDFNANTASVTLILDKSTTYLYEPISHALIFNVLKTKRDVRYVIDAAASDLVLSTTYRSVHAGRRFLASYSSLLVGSLQDLTVSGINRAASQTTVALSGNSTFNSNINIMTNMLLNGTTAEPAIVWPTLALSELNLAKTNIQENRAFIVSEVSAYIAQNFTLSNYPTYDLLKSERDAGYLIDAITYDLMFGGSSQTYGCATAFYNGTYSLSVSEICLSVFTRLKTIMPYVARGESIPNKSTGNSVTQYITTTSDYQSTLDPLFDILIDYVSGTDRSFTPNTGLQKCKVVSATVGGNQTGTYVVGNLLTFTANSVPLKAWITDVDSSGHITAVDFKITGSTAGSFTSGELSSNSGSTGLEIGAAATLGNGTGATLTLEYGPETFPTLPSGDNTTAYNNNLNYATITSIATDVVAYLSRGADQKINIETGGNRSMLANDFAMFNDLAYGIIANNGAFTEQVCTFTYYAHTGFWANNGSNLRGVGCSNTFGNYGLRASGFDVTELPDSVSMSNHMIQTARVYKQGEFAGEMTPTATAPATEVYIYGYNYKPTNSSVLEIDHTLNGGTIISYIVSSVQYTTAVGGTVLKLSLSSSGNSGTSSTGLKTELYHGQLVTLRSTTHIKYNNIDNVKPTRPSTALQYNDNLTDVYRIVSYNLSEASGDPLPGNTAILQSDSGFTYYTLTTDTKLITNGDPLDITATVVSTTGSTIVVNNVQSGTIAQGQYVTGIGFSNHTVSSVTGPSNEQYTVVLSAAPTTITAYGTVSFSFRTQGSKVSDIKVAVTPISNLGTIDQLNKGKYITAWNGRLHRIVKYVPSTTIATVTATETLTPSVWNSATTTLSFNANTTITGTIYQNTVIVGRRSDTGVIVFKGLVSLVSTTTGATSVVVSDGVATLPTSVSTIFTFGVTANSYIELSPTALINNNGTGDSIPALAYNSKTLQIGSTTNQLVTFNIPFNKSNRLPVVNSYVTVVGTSNTFYNGSFQVASVTDQTEITISSVANYKAGMVVTFQIFITTISGSTITTSTTHNLSIGNTISVVTTANGLDAGTSYTVASVNALAKTFTISTPSVTLTAGTSLNIEITTPTSLRSFTTSSNTVIQSINTNTNTLTLSPACWAPLGAPIRASLAAVVVSVTIVNGGVGYTIPPTLTFDSAPVTATATCKVSNGAITQVTVIIKGSGYIEIPHIAITADPSDTIITTPADLRAVLSTPVKLDAIASSGVNTNTVTLLYAGDPGTFDTNASTFISSVGSAAVDGTISGYYNVLIGFTAFTTAPTVGSYLKISGNGNNLYNGLVKVVSNTTPTTTAATVQFLGNPGTAGSVAGNSTAIAKTATSATSSQLGISKPFDVNTAYTLNIGYPAGVGGQVTTRISTCRATGHDFCDIGTGGYSTTNIPYSIYGDPSLSRQVSNETLDEGVGRCFYVSTNQDGIFRVGRFFSVDQGTGVVTLSSELALSNVKAFGFSGGGAVVTEFSTDSTMTDNSSNKAPVESAIRGYIDKRLGIDHGGSELPTTSKIGPGYLPLNGLVAMSGPLSLGGNYGIKGIVTDSQDNSSAVNVGYLTTKVNGKSNLQQLSDVNIILNSAAISQILIHNGTSWVNKTVTTTNGDVSITYTGNNVVTAIGPSKILDSMVSASAAIDQTKLKLDNAYAVQVASGATTDVITATAGSCTGTTVTLTFATQLTQPFAVGTRITVKGFTLEAYNGIWVVTGGSVTTVQYTVLVTIISNATILGTITALRGISAYNSAVFTSSNGWVDLATGTAANGVDISKIKHITNSTILGNLTDNTGVSAVTTLTPGAVVNAGDGIKNASFTSAGVMVVSSRSGSNNTYGIIAIATDGAANTIVKTGVNGEIDASQLKIDNKKVIDSTAASSSIQFYTPSEVSFMSATGLTEASSVMSVTTLETTSRSGKIQTTSLTTGASDTAGVVVGNWSVAAGSNWDLSQASTAVSADGLTASPNRVTNRPSLILDFANSKTLDPRVTFTRASIASYTNAQGVLMFAANNQPRFDHNVLGVSTGLLIEESATNTVPYSTTFVGWSQTGFDSLTPRTLRSNAAPNNSSAIEFNTSGLAGVLSTTLSSVSTTYSYVFSIWAKSVSGTASLSFSLNNTTWENLTITSSLARYTFTKVTPTSATQPIYIKVPASSQMVLWGAQFEKKSAGSSDTATSYIKTDWETTSTTSIVIASSGSIAFTVVANANIDIEKIPANSLVLITATGTGNTISGTVGSHVGTTLTVTVTSSSGTGTFASWTIQAGLAQSRTLEYAEITGTNFSSWYKSTEGTVIVTQTIASISPGDYNTVKLRSSTDANSIVLGCSAASGILTFKTSSNAISVNGYTTPNTNTLVIHGVAYKENNCGYGYNGNPVAAFSINATGGTRTSTTARITFSTQLTQPFAVGTTITVAGFTTADYNGSNVVTTGGSNNYVEFTISSNAVTPAVIPIGTTPTITTTSQTDILATIDSNINSLIIGNNILGVGVQNIARITYYPVRISDAELQRMTTQ